MTEKEKLPKQFYTAIWFIFFALVITVYVVQIRKQQRRLSNSDFTEGVILGLNKVAKGQQYINYSYSVKGKKYEGSVGVSFCRECENNCCQKGTRVKVRYERNYPQNSDLVH